MELGSGTSEKTRMLLDALRDSGSLRRFVPFDVDASVLDAAGSAIQDEYPGIDIDAVCGDFEEHLGKIPRGGRRLVAFLGSTIGNLTPGPRAEFLSSLSDTLQPGDSSAAGHRSGEGRRPAGARLRRQRGRDGAVQPQRARRGEPRARSADFDLDAFEHVAKWNADEERIEMWLRDSSAQRVHMRDLDLTVDFAAGEEMLTEVSCKFRPATAWTPNWPRRVCDARTGGPTTRATSGCRCRRGEGVRGTSSRALAGGPAAGRRVAPRQRRLLAAESSRSSTPPPDHARHEAEVGGYVAAAAAAPVLDAGRAAIGALTGLRGDDVVYTTGANNALDLLLTSWVRRAHDRLPARRIRTEPCDHGRQRFSTSARCPPTIAAASTSTRPRANLAADPPALVHLTALASHRGIAQPMAALADVCADLGLPLVLDAAQAMGHLDCAVGPAAIYSSSRKWIAGPRGVGFLAIRPDLAEQLRPRLPPPEWNLPISVVQRIEQGEANIAARIGYSVALGEYLARRARSMSRIGWPRSGG